MFPRKAQIMNHRAEALATRLEAGARALAEFTRSLTETEWQTRVPRDGRTIGAVVYYAAKMYPIEIQFAQLLAVGQRVPKSARHWKLLLFTRRR